MHIAVQHQFHFIIAREATDVKEGERCNNKEVHMVERTRIRHNRVFNRNRIVVL